MQFLEGPVYVPLMVPLYKIAIASSGVLTGYSPMGDVCASTLSQRRK